MENDELLRNIEKLKNNPKFYVSNKIGYDNWPDFGEGNNIKHNPDNKIASVYQIWGTEGYIPYIYHSIISQIMYSDVQEKANIFIFTDEGRYVYVSWLFRNILSPESIIKVKGINAVKYMIPNHEALKDYEIVSFIDSDMFFWSPQGTKYPFYKTVESYFELNKNKVILLGMDPNSVFNILYQRKETLCPDVSIEDYTRIIINGSGMSGEIYSNWVNNDTWKMSGVFIYENTIFKHPKYIEYSKMHADIGQKCDETVWNSWMKARNIETIDLIEGLDFHYSLYLDDSLNQYMDQNDSLYLLHPIVGEHLKNNNAIELLNKIKAHFKIYTEQNGI